MSSQKPQQGGKWVSRRVQQHQQAQPTTTGSKVMEDSAIAAARIKENQSSPAPDVDVPAATIFERQEATDALSNLSHNSEPLPFELQGDVRFEPCQTSDEFHAKLLKKKEEEK